jgi:hypothetical protein
MKIAQPCLQRYPSPTHVGGGNLRRWQNLSPLGGTPAHVRHISVCLAGHETTTESSCNSNTIEDCERAETLISLRGDDEFS